MRDMSSHLETGHLQRSELKEVASANMDSIFTTFD
eukprot:CAMPEP_0197447946 /NCGR_PEP_ID=MMETSP1175-20131217/15545_1 /TAXON_ID=1003142 /ORGANISM="Triceratium dubium, Strain CCMP147" /LENGTH=34 /DNA_ID= /DNA_START= /DNA_END= /DNA_ORIENTATION=